MPLKELTQSNEEWFKLAHISQKPQQNFKKFLPLSNKIVPKQKLLTVSGVARKFRSISHI